MEKESKHKRTTFYISEENLQAIERLAYWQRMSKKTIINSLLEAGIERFKNMSSSSRAAIYKEIPGKLNK